MKEHPQAEILRAIADGKEVEYRNSMIASDEWLPVAYIGILDRSQNICEFRVKPERVYPVTSLKANELGKIFSNGENSQWGFIAIANAAIKQYLIDTEGGK